MWDSQKSFKFLRLPLKLIEKIRFSHYDLFVCLRAMNDLYSPFNSYLELFKTMDVTFSLLFLLLSGNVWEKIYIFYGVFII